MCSNSLKHAGRPLKQLELIDMEGNGASYELCLPEAVTEWRVKELHNFLSMTLPAATEAGFLAKTPDPLRHETLRRLVCTPLSTLQRPVQFAQDNVLLDPDDPIDLSKQHTELHLIRDTSVPMGDPRKLSLATCNKQAFSGARESVIRLWNTMISLEQQGITDCDGAPVFSFSELIDCFDSKLSPDQQLKILFKAAETVHASPFENVSKLNTATPVCSGWEMWARMQQGGGGICAEKSAAMNFFMDALGVETFYVAASQYSIPNDFDRRLKQYVRSEGQTEAPVWIQHLLPGFRLNGQDYLMDVSNGNLPLLFITGADLERYLLAGYRARMVYSIEHMQLKRISNWAGDALLTIAEFHLPQLHFQYIFDQGLGLHISSTFYIGAFFDWGTEQSARYQGHYTAMAEELNYPRPRFYHAGNLEHLPDQATRNLLQDALSALRQQYAEPYYTGDFTFVLQPLNNARWQRPKISSSIRKTLGGIT